MSSDEETVNGADDGAKAPDAIEDAMAEAMASMERREKGDDEEEGVSIEVETGDSPKASASDAVTEALITAKKELEGVLEQTQKEAGHLREKWLRAAADLENYKKRAARERDDVMKFGNEKLLKDFLPLIDDIERAVGAVEKAGTNEGGLLDGVKLVHKKFLSQLERHGVTTFESKGEPFDPNRHEAVQQMHAEAPQGEVFEVLQRGFMLSDRLLRPAMVVVSLGPAGDKEGSDAE